jgi:hypothetical protein
MMRSKGKNSWKECLIKSLERAKKMHSLGERWSFDGWKEISQTNCYLCEKAKLNGGFCRSCLLYPVLRRLGTGCIMLTHQLTKDVGYDVILETVRQTPREKLTPYYLNKVGIPRELKEIMQSLESSIRKEKQCV